MCQHALSLEFNDPMVCSAHGSDARFRERVCVCRTYGRRAGAEEPPRPFLLRLVEQLGRRVPLQARRPPRAPRRLRRLLRPPRRRLRLRLLLGLLLRCPTRRLRRLLLLLRPVLLWRRQGRRLDWGVRPEPRRRQERQAGRNPVRAERGGLERRIRRPAARAGNPTLLSSDALIILEARCQRSEWRGKPQRSKELAHALESIRQRVVSPLHSAGV